MQSCHWPWVLRLRTGGADCSSQGSCATLGDLEGIGLGTTGGADCSSQGSCTTLGCPKSTGLGASWTNCDGNIVGSRAALVRSNRRVGISNRKCDLIAVAI